MTGDYLQLSDCPIHRPQSISLFTCR